MIDIHSHIIPRVDDGSKSMDHTMILVYKAYRQGVNTIFATPHSEAFFKNAEIVLCEYHKMRTLLRRFIQDVDIYLGCEVLCSKENMGEILNALAAGKIPTMNQTKYVLIEFNSWTSAEEIELCVSLLQQANWIPMIAHIERYKNIVGDLSFVEKIKRKGCLIQINIYNLEEYADRMIRDWISMLVFNKLVDFLGTDMHEFDFRPPSVEQGLSWLKENCSESYFDSITRNNAVEKLLLHKVK